MFIPTEYQESAAVRLELTDAWSLQEFEDLCSSIRGAYELIDRFMCLIDTLAQEAEEERRSPGPETEQGYQPYQTAWHDLYYGRPERIRDGRFVFPQLTPLDEVLSAISPFSTTLRVVRIRLESPGFLELVGSWNPLRIIADAIRDYRHENTRRMEIDARLAIERDKLRAGLAREILRRAPTDRHAERLVEIVNSVIEPSATMLEKVVSNPRILDVAVRGSGGG